MATPRSTLLRIQLLPVAHQSTGLRLGRGVPRGHRPAQRDLLQGVCNERCSHRAYEPCTEIRPLPRPRPQECDVCDAFCSSGIARAAKDAIKCSIDLPVLGLTAAAHTSDAGQQIAYGHGAIRKNGRSPTPETAYLEQFDILVNNDIDQPRINRDSVSCRRPHRESRTGTFTPPLDGTGKPTKRTGFMVPCSTSSDCYSRCGEHPMSGHSYVCTPNPLFYTFHVVNDSLTEETLAIELSAQDLAPGIPVTADFDSFQTRLALLEARPRWLPVSDTVTTQSYFVDEPGENKFDIPAGSYGVCTDVRMDYMHTNCESRAGSAAVIGLIGCTAKLGWNIAYCGASVERFGPDFSVTSISSESLEWPRVLVEGGTVNGIVQQRVVCGDAIDCQSTQSLNAMTTGVGLTVSLCCVRSKVRTLRAHVAQWDGHSGKLCTVRQYLPDEFWHDHCGRGTGAFHRRRERRSFNRQVLRWRIWWVCLQRNAVAETGMDRFFADTARALQRRLNIWPAGQQNLGNDFAIGGGFSKRVHRQADKRDHPDHLQIDLVWIFERTAIAQHLPDRILETGRAVLRRRRVLLRPLWVLQHRPRASGQSMLLFPVRFRHVLPIRTRYLPILDLAPTQ